MELQLYKKVKFHSWLQEPTDYKLTINRGCFSHFESFFLTKHVAAVWKLWVVIFIWGCASLTSDDVFLLMTVNRRPEKLPSDN